MINTCQSPEFCRKVETDGFGVNIMPEDVTILADAIEELYDDKDRRLEMGRIARKIAEEQFDRPRAYQRVETLIHSLIEANKEKKSGDFQ